MTLSFDDFRRAVATAGEVALEDVKPDSRFVEDLGFDSLRLLELLAALADLGVEDPESITLEARAVGKAYDLASAGAQEPLQP